MRHRKQQTTSQFAHFMTSLVSVKNNASLAEFGFWILTVLLVLFKVIYIRYFIMGQEAQRIMAASMNKIASSRNRRTGVDLHRDLLITTVLHKARNMFITDNTFSTDKNKIPESECMHNAEELSRECREDEVEMDVEDLEDTLLPAKDTDLCDYRSDSYKEMDNKYDNDNRYCSKRHFEEVDDDDEVFIESKKFKLEYALEDLNGKW